MSAVAEGSKIVNAAREVTEKSDMGVMTSGATGNENIQGGAKAQMFPAKFSARDPMDDTIRIRQQLMDPATGQTPFGQAVFDDSMANYVLRKEKAIEAANFDAWFGKNFNLNDLASRKWAQQAYPEYFEKRIQQMTERADLALRIKKMELMGPKDEEDLIIQFGLNTGRILLEPGWDTIGYQPDQSKEDQLGSTQLLRGLVRLPRFFSNAQRTTRGYINDQRTGDAFSSNLGALSFPNMFPNTAAGDVRKPTKNYAYSVLKGLNMSPPQ